MNSSFVNVFGKVTAAAAISLFINLPSQADAAPDLCGFNREDFLKQHAPKLKKTYETLFSFDDEEDSSLTLISDDTLRQEALDKGYGWVYGCPKDLNLYEAARLNPWIKENFDKSFPTLSSASIDEMDYKAFYLRYVQDAVLTTFSSSTPLVWVEGVAPEFDWADKLSEKAKLHGESWIERAHDLQVQARDARLEGFKRDLQSGGILNPKELSARHLWVADLIKHKIPATKHSQLITHLLELEKVLPGFLTETPEDFITSDAFTELNSRVRKKAQHLIDRFDLELQGYDIPALDSSGKSPQVTRTPDEIDTAVKHKRKAIKDTLEKTKRNIECRADGNPLFELVSLIKKNFTIDMSYLSSYVLWLNTGEVTLPANVSEFMDANTADYLKQFQGDYRTALTKATPLQPEVFLKNFKPTMQGLKAPLKSALDLQARAIAVPLHFKVSFKTLTDNDARKHILNEAPGFDKSFFKVLPGHDCATEREKIVLNKLNLSGKKPKKNQTFSEMYVFKDEFGKEQLRYFVAHRGMHTYLVCLQPTK